MYKFQRNSFEFYSSSSQLSEKSQYLWIYNIQQGQYKLLTNSSYAVVGYFQHTAQNISMQGSPFSMAARISEFDLRIFLLFHCCFCIFGGSDSLLLLTFGRSSKLANIEYADSEMSTLTVKWSMWTEFISCSC